MGKPGMFFRVVTWLYAKIEARDAERREAFIRMVEGDIAEINKAVDDELKLIGETTEEALVEKRREIYMRVSRENTRQRKMQLIAEGRL